MTNVVRTSGVVLIIDQKINGAQRQGLDNCRLRNDGFPLLFDPEELSRILSESIGSLALVSEKTLFIFPGNSGQIVREYVTLPPGSCETSVFAKWIYGTDLPASSVGQIPTKTYVDYETECVFILDDVVSSGQTIKRIRERNLWKFTKARWCAGCWIDRGVISKGFDLFHSSITVRHSEDDERKVPVNSLSTLLEEPKWLRNYSDKNFSNPEEFISILQEIRKSKK